MKRNLTAFSLFSCSIAIIVGMLVNNKYYWFAADSFVILICGINGFIILRSNDKSL